MLTNSPFGYTDQVMTHLLADVMPEYPSWRHYFEFVICSAGKPRFFQDGRPLMERDGEVLRPVREKLERGKVYEGGNLEEFERLVGMRSSSVLYVGDHIYGDILRSKKESSWHTLMVIQEMDEEIAAYEACSDDLGRQRALDEARNKLEDELRFHQSRIKELTRGSASAGPLGDEESDRTRTKRALERVRAELRSLTTEYDMLAERISQRFPSLLGAAAEGTKRDELLRPAGGSVRGHLHAQGVVPARVFAAAVLPFAV
ncbi:MAG: 5'-nucleotidase domain-containing protein [Pseudomonadota bacterium]